MGIFDRFKRLPPREAFVKDYIAALRRSGEKRSVEFNEKDFELLIKAADGKIAGVRHLANCYREHDKAPVDQRRAIIDKFVRAMIEPSLPDDWPSVMPMIRPTLKDRGAVEVTYLQQKAVNPTTAEVLPFQPLTSDLAIFPVVDLPESMLAVTAKKLRSWGVGLDQVVEAGLHNFRTANRANAFTSFGRLQVAQVGDSYDATRLLLSEQIAALGLQGQPVALAADRELLILAGSADLPALGDMVNLAMQRFKEGVRYVSARPVVLIGGTWRDFEPPEGVAEPFGQFRRFMDHRRYENQGDLLRKDLAARSEDVFVAKYVLGSNDNGVTYRSNVSWGENVVTLLPEADQISFYQGSTKTLRRSSWERAMAVVKHRMEVTDHYPPRWKVRGFPTPEEFAAMGVETIENVG